MNDVLELVDMDTARAAPGVRLVVAAAIPSPWSEAAKAILRVKRIPARLVRYGRDQAAALAAWTGARNVPVVLCDDEPPRTGWAEILALAERLGGDVSLVPADAELRARLFGMAHELLGEGGLGWSSRLILIDGGLTSAGSVGFPLRLSQYLAPRYGYAPDRIAPAHRRIHEIAALFDRQLAASRAAGHRYLLGDELTALDLYLATALTPIVGVSEAECPALRPELRAAFAYLGAQVGAALGPALRDHRAFVFDRHLGWPIAL